VDKQTDGQTDRQTDATENMSVFSFAPRPSTRHCPHLLLSAGQLLPIDISFFAGLSAVGAECSLISCARRHDHITPVLASLHRLPVATEILDLEKPRFSVFRQNGGENYFLAGISAAFVTISGNRRHSQPAGNSHTLCACIHKPQQ